MTETATESTKGQDEMAREAPIMAAEAYYGVAGAAVRTIGPHSEADPVGVLSSLLVGVGNVIGRGPHLQAGSTAHYGNEYVCLVGPSGRGRKGESWNAPRPILGLVDEAWLTTRVRSGLSSGEGLIYHVRDQREEMQPIREKGRVVDYQKVVVDEGEDDKRLLCIEAEFASVLRRMQGETNSLSAIMRDAYDKGSLSTLTKNSPLRATGAHISFIAHTTREELVTSLTNVDLVNGYGNRILFMMVERSKCLPDIQPMPPNELDAIAEALRAVVKTARPRAFSRDDDARDLWRSVYPRLSHGEPGLIGAVLGRAEVHVLRLSLIYAVLDGSAVIQFPHLQAALAVWEYAEESARRIFGQSLGLTVADTILMALRKRGPLDRTQIRDLFSRNKDKAEIDAALTLLEQKRLARKTTKRPEGGVGRPIEVWEAVVGTPAPEDDEVAL